MRRFESLTRVQNDVFWRDTKLYWVAFHVRDQSLSTSIVYILTPFRSLLESISLLVELIENFKFSLPSEEAEIMRVPAGIMIPMVSGRLGEGAQMPLHVSLVQ